MPDRVLEKMFRKENEKKLNYHLKILNHFWENWDKLAGKQQDGIDGDYCLFHDAPEAFIPVLLYKGMTSDTVDYLNELLWDYHNYRRRPGKFSKRCMSKKMTRTKFIKVYLEKMRLD